MFYTALLFRDAGTIPSQADLMELPPFRRDILNSVKRFLEIYSSAEIS